MNTMYEVNPTKAFALIQDGALLVDVREPGEVSKKSFDVANIIMIPSGELKKRFREIPLDCRIIIACRTGIRSAMATRFLLNHGYTQAVNMQKGIVNWEKDGLPVTREQQKTSGSWLKKIFGRQS